MTTSLITSTTSSLTLRDLDNAIFLDWIACQAGFWVPDGAGTYLRVELDRGAVLRVTGVLDDDVAPYTVVELQQHGSRRGGLTVKRMRPALPLAQLRRRTGAQRLLLEAELQRRRLYPHWITWVEGQSLEQYDVRDSDLYLLRFLPKARFDDLVVIARLLPRIGPGLLYTLFQLSAIKATRLVAGWAAAGEHERFRDVGEPFERILAEYCDTPLLTQLLTVNALMADHGYARRLLRAE